MVIDINKRNRFGQRYRGLSGHGGKPVALSMVYETAGVVKIPVIGCGGIATGRDAIEFLMAGATAVQVGTATFVNPHAPLDVIDGIKDFMSKKGIDNISKLIGSAR